MGKNKLRKFADMAGYECVYQYPREELLRSGFPHKGDWNGRVFANPNPITLELGCGRGEYTVALAKSEPTRNFIGIDIKGARMWTGASQVEREGITNAAFLRCEIENITSFFAPGEVDSIWITFPDPQMKKRRKRLTSTRFLNLYRNIMKPGGVINLKTDSPFLYEYTRRLVELNGLETLAQTDDLYGSGLADPVTSIKTYYEQQWLSRGKKIKFISFRLPAEGELEEPCEEDIEKDDYRAIPRPNFPGMASDANATGCACTGTGTPADVKALVKGLTPAEALAKLDGYIASHPDCEEAYITRGLKQWSLGNRAGAINDYLTAIRLNPQSRAKEALKAVNEILDYRNKDLYNP